jgi:DNA-binding beta-propeller fold protein YncE
MPGQIAFTPDGNKLVIVRKEGFLVESVVSQGSFQTQWTGRIDVYVLKNGTPVSCSNPASYLYSRGPTAGSMPFALAFTEKGYLLVTEVLGNASTGGSPFGASTMSSFQINSDGSLKLPPLSGSVPSTTSAMCWVVRYGKYAYAGNQLSGSISAYQVLDSGTPNLVHLGDVATGAAPSDMAITADGKYLYVLTSGTAPYPSIQGFTVGKDTGSLTPFGAAGFPVPGSPLAGQAGMALAEF